MDVAVRAEKVTRRSFLGYMIGAIGAFIATALGASSTIFAASPLLSEKRATSVSLGSVSAFQVGVPKAVEFTVARKDGWVVEETTKSVWVVRMGENEFTTFNPRCTHLGCIVSWIPDQKMFRSPCHGGYFSIQGEVMAGPPPRPLDKMPSRVEGGKLIVDYRDYRLGVQEKVEV